MYEKGVGTGTYRRSDGPGRSQYRSYLFVVQAPIEEPKCVGVVRRTNWRAACSAARGNIDNETMWINAGEL